VGVEVEGEPVGTGLGASVGACDGAAVGTGDGRADGAGVGVCDGVAVGTGDGRAEGDVVGRCVGFGVSVVGACVGECVGGCVGCGLVTGGRVGRHVGRVGAREGASVSADSGGGGGGGGAGLCGWLLLEVGSSDGAVGAKVGWCAQCGRQTPCGSASAATFRRGGTREVGRSRGREIEVMCWKEEKDMPSDVIVHQRVSFVLRTCVR
jgi:hypothetical protein